MSRQAHTNKQAEGHVPRGTQAETAAAPRPRPLTDTDAALLVGAALALTGDKKTAEETGKVGNNTLVGWGWAALLAVEALNRQAETTGGQTADAAGWLQRLKGQDGQGEGQ